MNPTSVLSGLGSAVAADPGLGAPATGTPGGGDLFLALVEGLLAQVDGRTNPDEPGTAEDALSPGVPATPAVLTEPAADADAHTDTATETETETETDGTPTSATVESSVLAALAGLVPHEAALAGLVPAPTAPATGRGPATGEAGLLATTVDAEGEPTTPASTKPAVSTLAGGIPAPAAARAAAAPLPTVESNPSSPAAPAVIDDGAPAPSATAAATAPVTEASSTVSTPSTSPVAAVGAPTATTAAAPTAPVAAPAAADPHRVIDQVFSQIVQSAGSSQQGTQRLTVRLNPENLGEVRVVLTQRHGELQVTLAAGDQARASLLEGSHELRRLLESVGHHDSRIVVRDPAAPAQTTSAPTAIGRSDLTGDSAGGADDTGSAWSEEAPEQREGRSHHSGSNNATDGTPVTTNPSRRPDDAGRAHTGLDLSM